MAYAQHTPYVTSATVSDASYKGRKGFTLKRTFRTKTYSYTGPEVVKKDSSVEHKEELSRAKPLKHTLLRCLNIVVSGPLYLASYLRLQIVMRLTVYPVNHEQQSLLAVAQ